MEKKSKNKFIIISLIGMFAIIGVVSLLFDSINKAPELSLASTPLESEETMSTTEKDVTAPIIYDVEWSDDKSGVITTIDGAVIEQKEDFLEGGTYNELSVYFKVENTSDANVTTYPNQATLMIGSTQIEANLIASDDIGGEILNGAIKEGFVTFDLDESIDVNSISDVRLTWTHYVSLLDDTNYDINLSFTKTP